jgi:TRAP-type C4-dicarboxylate transport system permease large subunit
MEWYVAGGLLIGTVVGLMAIGIPVAFAFMTANIIGTLVFVGSLGGLSQVVDNSTALISRFQFVPVPMFILMGSLFFYSGLAIRVFDALDTLFGRLPGRLCFLTVAGGATFSTLTGSSMANTAMLGSLMVPEMQRRGYSRRMSMGPILGTGGLAMIIPPSNLGVLLASIASIDVGRMLVAGLIPGIVLAILYFIHF